MIRRSFLVLLLTIPFAAGAADIQKERRRMESLTKGLAKGEAIELRTLEIRARIYEPSVTYILDRTRLDVDYEEEEIRLAPRIARPILENRF
jgi:hypothetical protein